MSNDLPSERARFADDGGETFLIRWRGKQEGPYPAALIEAKLAANQIGLLHEISHQGRWITLRDYLAERDALLRAERQAQEEQRRAELLAEERRKNDLLQARAATPKKSDSLRPSPPVVRKAHRAETILALSIIGLIVCCPLCLVAWVMGDGDLREMDAGIMDASGRSTTATGRSLGVLGTVLWLVAVIVLLLI